MARTEIARMRRALDEIFLRADDDDQDLEVRADLAKYACLRLTGFLEQSIISLGKRCVGKMSGAQAESFAYSHLARSFNPNKDALLKFVARFDSSWCDELEALLAEDERGQTITSIVGIRNQIAHGQNQGVSIGRLYDYRRVVDEAVDFLIAKFDPV